MEDDMITVACPPCFHCRKRATLTVKRSEFDAWAQGKHIQMAFPGMSADDRELLITGTHPTCWDEMFEDD